MRGSMFSRRISLRPLNRIWCRAQLLPKPGRNCRAASSAVPTAIHSSGLSPLASLTSELEKIAPRIDVDASDIHIIDTPAQFYQTLKDKILQAKSRIFLSTLYIGKSETELIATIRQALEQAPELQVSVLTDALRGTRESPQPSCASLIAPLIRDFPDQVRVHMYHTPNITGIKKALVPKRINEGWGLQHMKLYGIDDEIILSGANLSDDYFTNRQDRYHRFASRRITDYFARIHAAVVACSFQVEPDNAPAGYKLIWTSADIPSPLESASGHRKAAASTLSQVLTLSTARTRSAPTLDSWNNSNALQKRSNTAVFPLFCLPGVYNNELPAIQSLLDLSRPISQFTFTAGYFNPHPLITQTLVALSSKSNKVAGGLVPGLIFTASPDANGFFGSSGISGMLPAAYTNLSAIFLRFASSRNANIHLYEWQRGRANEPHRWTYHAKGIWATISNDSGISRKLDKTSDISGLGADADSGPNVTVIGSSNYTTRSYNLDIEVGAMIVTEDADLRAALGREVQNLRKDTQEVDLAELESEERRADWKVKLAMWIVRKVGGAL